MNPRRDNLAEHEPAPGSDRLLAGTTDNPIVAFMQSMTLEQWASIERVQANDDATPIAAEQDADG